MNQLKSIYSSPFTESHSHPIRICFSMIFWVSRVFWVFPSFPMFSSNSPYMGKILPHINCILRDKKIPKISTPKPISELYEHFSISFSIVIICFWGLLFYISLIPGLLNIELTTIPDIVKYELIYVIWFWLRAMSDEFSAPVISNHTKQCLFTDWWA